MIDWNSIDTVLLDMDGTLLDLHYDNHFWEEHLPEVYAAHHHITLDQAQTILFGLMKASKGRLDWYCLDYWSRELDMDIPELKRQTQHKIKERPHTLAFLKFLREQKKQVVLATNAHPKTLALKLSVVEIEPYFDDMVSSHELGAPKEEQIFWERLQARLGFESERTLFVDDTVAILQAAEDFGVAHVLAIHQPDSQITRQVEDYPAITDFNEIMPGG